MRSIKAPVVAEATISKSRFICHLAPVRTFDEAWELVERVRAADPGATRYCSAVVLGDDGSIHRVDDDGEPGGTAGTPMLEALRKAGFTAVAAVVVRHFGGIKLGAGGLARAYGGAVRAALAAAVPANPVVYEEYELSVLIAVSGLVAHLLREHARVLAETCDELARFRYRVRADGAAALHERLAIAVGGSVQPHRNAVWTEFE